MKVYLLTQHNKRGLSLARRIAGTFGLSLNTYSFSIMEDIKWTPPVAKAEMRAHEKNREMNLIVNGFIYGLLMSVANGYTVRGLGERMRSYFKKFDVVILHIPPVPIHKLYREGITKHHLIQAFLNETIRALVKETWGDNIILNTTPGVAPAYTQIEKEILKLYYHYTPKK